MKHRKEYIGDGTVVFCDDTIVASSPKQSVNFSLRNCPRCDMEVDTIGCSPDADKVNEVARLANSGQGR